MCVAHIDLRAHTCVWHSGPHADLSDGTASALVTHSNRRSVQQTSICFMLYGLFLIATLIAEMNVYVMGKTQGSSAFQRKIDRVRHEMDYYAVPHELESQVSTGLFPSSPHLFPRLTLLLLPPSRFARTTTTSG